MDDRLSSNSLFLVVEKSMTLCVPVFVLDGTLRNIFGRLRNVFGHLWILSDPYKKSCHSKDNKCDAYKCKKVGRYKFLSKKYACLNVEEKEI